MNPHRQNAVLYAYAGVKTKIKMPVSEKVLYVVSVIAVFAVFYWK